MIFRLQTIAQPATAPTIDLVSARCEHIEQVRLRHQELVEADLLEDALA